LISQFTDGFAGAYTRSTRADRLVRLSYPNARGGIAMTDLTREMDVDQPVATAIEQPPAANATPQQNLASVATAPQNPTGSSAELSLPSLEHCQGVIEKSKSSGLEAIPELPALLKPECPELAEILGSSAIATSLGTFNRQDAESIAQQKELMKEANLANLCLLGAGVTSAIILAYNNTAGQGGAAAKDAVAATGQPNVTLTLLLGVLTLAFGAGAAYFGFVARDQGRVGRWQTSRSDAETARHDVFATMASSVTSAKAAVFGLGVVLRDLLEDQRTYLVDAALKHRKSSEITSRWGGLATALAFIGGSGAIVASQGGGSWTNWIILAGVFGAAIGAYAANRDALNRDRANADRYEKTLVALDGIKGRSDEVARKIAGGEPKALTVYTDAITDLLATEFKQWQEGTAQAEASLAKLDGRLGQLGKTGKPGGEAQ
jgi:hypothetical protein